MQITVMFIPSGSHQVVQVDSTSTLQDVITHLKIESTVEILLDGTTAVSPSDYATTSLQGVTEIWAVAGSKGA